MIKKNAEKNPRPSRKHHQVPVRVRRSRTGLGLFAEAPIRKDKFIIEYRGKRLLWNKVEDIWNKYLFEVNKRWAIDGSSRRNTARYINHSCSPNAVPYEVRGRIHIYARKNIHPGDEITYDYGREYFDELLQPIGCKCVACAGPNLRKRSAKRRRRRR